MVVHGQRAVGVEDPVEQARVVVAGVAAPGVAGPAVQVARRRHGQAGAVPVGRRIGAVGGVVDDVAGHDRVQLPPPADQVHVAGHDDGRVLRQVDDATGGARVTDEGDDAVGLDLAAGIVGAATQVRRDEQQVLRRGRRQVDQERRFAVGRRSADQPGLQDRVTADHDVAVIDLRGVPRLAGSARQERADARGGVGRVVVPDLAQQEHVGIDGIEQPVLGVELRCGPQAVAQDVP